MERQAKAKLERSHSSLSSCSWVTAEEELTPPQDSPFRHYKERALLYIDNSNVFISAQKHSAFLRGFRERIHDTTCRIDMKKLYKLALNNREKIGKGKLFGSPSALAPAQLESVWEAYAKDIEVILSKRNVNSKEKCVDTELVASAVEELIHYGRTSKEEEDEEEEDSWGVTTIWTNVFILFSGDADMKPVVRMALKYGWKVEIWSFKINVADCLKRLAQDEEKVTLKFIDGPLDGGAGGNGQAKIFDQICFYETEWKQRDDENRLDRSLLLKFNSSKFLTGIEEVKRRKALINKMVQMSSKLFRLPTQAYIVNPENPTEIVLICGPPEHPDKNKPPLYSFNDDVWPKRHKLLAALEDDGCEKVTPYQGFHQKTKEKQKEEEFQKSLNNQLINRPRKNGDLCPLSGSFARLTMTLRLPDDDPGQILSGAFTVVEPKKKKYGIQGASGKICRHDFTCTNYPQCADIHSEDERRYFHVHRDVAKCDRKSYKTVKCSMLPCKFQEESWLCRFAHSENEARCKNCKKIGHFLSTCRTPSKFK